MRHAACAAAALLAACAVAPPHPADPEPLTVFVAIDDASKATLGAFPVDRRVYARAIRAAKALGAKGVALKFFLDRPSRPESDRELATAEHELPVLMQVDGAPPGEGETLSPKLARDGWDLRATADPLVLDGIAYPLPEFLSAAHGLGFVEARLDGAAQAVELAAAADSVPVASLQLAIAELALGTRATLRGNRLELAGHGFALDRRGRLLCDSVHGPAPRPYGIDALLAGTIPARAIRGKVVVLGYLRSDSPRLTVAGRELPIHELFYRQVACLARRVTGD
jgi:hypothetical protein